MDADNNSENNSPLSKITLEHIISFSDAIFAFSITFMAISIQLPDLSVNNLTEQQFMSKLLQVGRQFEIYAVSFMIIGIYWISYHLVFNQIKLSHSILVWLNLLFLFFITLISFATDLDFKYSHFHIVFILYESILAITASLLVFIWLHALKQKILIDSAMNKFQWRLTFYELIIPPSIFLISIGVSFIDFAIAPYLWILIFVAKIVTRRRFSKIHNF
jgi:uncharacterized membrane protein